ncbi:hypothetical protein GCM10027053_26130 [Intrasporangium mesophilum]
MALSLLAAECLVERKDSQKAISFYAQAAEQAAMVGAVELEWRTRTRIGDVHAEARRWREAQEHCVAVERIVDRMWTELLGDANDRHFFADKAHLYDQAMLCRLRLGWPANALETLERGKTRFLVDLIARRHVQPREGLAQVDEDFWRAIGRRRPVIVSRSSASISETEFELDDVALSLPTGVALSRRRAAKTS